MAEEEKTEGSQESPKIKNCLSCGQPFEPRSKTNRICQRAPCRRKRSRPWMYTEAVNHPNKPDPQGGLRFE